MSRKPVLIQHGLLDCSMSWFLHQNMSKLDNLVKIAYLMYWQDKVMTFGLATTEVLNTHLRILTRIHIGITILTILFLMIFQLWLISFWIRLQKKSWSTLGILRGQLNFFVGWICMRTLEKKYNALLDSDL